MQIGRGISGHRKLARRSKLGNFYGYGGGGIIRFRGAGFLCRRLSWRLLSGERKNVRGL